MTRNEVTTEMKSAKEVWKKTINDLTQGEETQMIKVQNVYLNNYMAQ